MNHTKSHTSTHHPTYTQTGSSVVALIQEEFRVGGIDDES
jgi:hypothetical protein